jgi:LysR family transcriptional activator of nhaA
MDWLNYHHLFYFWTVCKEGGFSKAATKLCIAQSAVSSQVLKLEEFLGEKLMERGPRGFTLTEAGQVTLAQAEEIFRQGNDLVQYFRSGKMKASFRIGALGGLSKNLQLKLLSSTIQDAEIELVLEVGDAGVLLERLLKYQLDAVLSDVPFPSSEAEPLTQVAIASEPVCLVSKTKVSKAKSLVSLMKNGVYLPAKSSPVTSGLLDYFASEQMPIVPRGFVDDIALLRLLALETDAIVAIPRIGVRREIESGQLHVLHEFKKLKQEFFLIHRQKGKRHPQLIKLIKQKI